MSTFVKPEDAVPVTLARSAQINNLSAAVEAAFGLLPDEDDIAADTVVYGVCTSTVTNAYIVTLTTALAGYSDGMLVCFKAVTTNTGAATINVVTSTATLGVKSLTRHAGGAMAAGDLAAGQFYNFRYNSSTDNFELQQAALSEITGGASIVVASSLADDPAPTLSANLKVSSYYFTDANGNEYFKFNPVASAVNEFTVRNAATLTGPRLEVSGSDANIDLVLVPKGTGGINLEDKPLKRAKIMDYCETVETVVSSAGTLELDLETANQFITTLTEDVTTFTISNFVTSGTASAATLYLTQAATAKTVDWTAMSVLWPDGIAPDLTTNSSKHVIVFSSPDGGSTVYGFHASANAAEPA